MPLKLNIGLNKKVGEANYSSRGASVNLEIELDSQLVGDPTKLQERIRQCFGMVRASLDEELNGHGNGYTAPGTATQGTRPTPATGNGNGPVNRANGQRGNGPRPATQSQVKAILAIARRHRINVGTLLQERFQVARPDDLSIGEASEVIDELKATDSSKGS